MNNQQPEYTNRCDEPRMLKYTSQAIEIEAMQYRPGFFEDSDYPDGVIFELGPNPGEQTCVIDTLEGRTTVSPGDWIIRGTEGELYPCKPSVFDRKYRPSPPIVVEQPREEFDEILPIKGIDKAPLEIPTPGRIVHVVRGEARYPGMVIQAHTDQEGVDNAIVQVHIQGWPEVDDPIRSIPHTDYAPESYKGWCWEWMPYQRGQLKKLEEVQAIEWPGLRRDMTTDELDNRFTYHAPKPEQIVSYGEIRSEAKAFARTLLAHCPPSPELASALDHLDTVVFKANAAIARHS